MLNLNNQSGILQNNLALQQKLEDRKVFEQFLQKTDHVTCDAPKGRLVKETLPQQFGAMFTDTIKDVQNLGGALSAGKSNDHSLGRMNDLGMKLGGSLIAAALMGSKATVNKKLMEIIGFGTFFSVMSLWPKVAIDLPTKLRHGFNPHQKYIDSQGRKKQFFQDNQYLPWDVWSKEDINKVADKMNVPKDLKDREEFTKEKMRTIALQDNTLWMLTAGFATPLLTSLACNRIEEGLKGPLARFNLSTVSHNIKNADKQVEGMLKNKSIFGAQDVLFGELISELKEGKVPENFAERLGGIFNLTNLADDQLKDLLAKQNIGVEDLIKKLFQKTGFAFEDSAFLKRLTENETPETVSKVLAELNNASTALSKGGRTPSLQEIAQHVLNNNFQAEGKWIDVLAGMSESELAKFGKEMATYDKAALSSGADILERIYSTGVKPAQAQMKIFGKNVQILNNVSGEKYNGFLKVLIKSLGFTDNEIKALHASNEAFGGKLQSAITEKLTELSKPGNEAKLQKFLSKLDKQLESIDKGSSQGAANGKIKQLFNGAVAKLKSALGRSSEGLSNLEGTKLGSALSGNGISSTEASIVENSMTSVSSTVAGIKNAVELERKILSGDFLKEWEKAAKACGYTGGLPEGPEELYKLARKCAWQCSFGDLMNKAHMDGNGSFYESVINTVFSGNSANSDVSAWQTAAKRILLGEEYIPNAALKTMNAVAKPNSVKFAEFGNSLLSAGKDQIDEIYKNRKWMKVFGGATIALVGFTFLSQLFFGKVKDAHLYQKKTENNQDTFESGK